MHLSGNGICEIANEDDNSVIFSDVGQLLLQQHGSTVHHHHHQPVHSSTTPTPSPPLTPGTSVKTFAKLKKLVWLDLSGNRINHISANYLPKPLVTLDLSRNILPALPTQAIQHLHDLKILSLKDNLIAQLADVELVTRLRLEKLDLSVNNIDEMPADLFNGTAHVKSINFDKNFLKHLPAQAFHNMATVHLVLAFNRLQVSNMRSFDLFCYRLRSRLSVVILFVIIIKTMIHQ